MFEEDRGQGKRSVTPGNPEQIGDRYIRFSEYDHF